MDSDSEKVKQEEKKEASDEENNLPKDENLEKYNILNFKKKKYVKYFF